MNRERIKKGIIYLLVIDIILISIYGYLLFSVNLLRREIKFPKENRIEQPSLNNATLMITDTTKDRQKIDSYFVQNDGIIDFLKQIGDSATVSGLDIEITGVSVNSLGEIMSYDLLSIDLSTSGEWNSLLYFISELEFLPFKLEVKDFSAAHFENRLWTSNISISVLKLK